MQRALRRPEFLSSKGEYNLFMVHSAQAEICFSVRINISQVIWIILDKEKHMFPPMCYVFCGHSIENIFRPLFLKYLMKNNENFPVAIWFFDNYLNVLMASNIQLKIPKHRQKFKILIHSIEFNFNFLIFSSWMHSRLSITFFSVYQQISDVLWVCFYARKAKR